MVAEQKGQVRCFGYINQYDRSITAALSDEFDGVFMIVPWQMSTLLLDRLVSIRHKVVTLFTDLTEYGIPMIDLASPRFIWRTAKHFTDLGHTHVDCLNTQPDVALIGQRIEAWKAAAEKFGLDTVVHNHAVKPFQHTDEAAHLAAPAVIKNPERPITG